MSKAAEVLFETINESKTPMVTLSSQNERLRDLLNIFIEAVHEIDEGMVFSAADIVAWAKKFAAEEGNIDLPQALQKTHTLGKILAQECESYGFTKVGTYGNKQIFTLKEDAA